MRYGWWLVARTKLIDDAVLHAIADGCDRGAESGGRPAGESPRCRLTRRAVALADPEARDAFLAEALRGATRALVLTEGPLMYLRARDVAAISAAGPGLQARVNRRSGGMLASAPFAFAPPNGLGHFEELGWHAVEAESVFTAASRFRRLSRWCVRWPDCRSRTPAGRAATPTAGGAAHARSLVS